MATYKKKPDFITSEVGIKLAEALKSMVADSTFMTESSFSADLEKYPDNLIPFVDKHLAYLRKNPAIDPDQYLSNLKLMTRIRH